VARAMGGQRQQPLPEGSLPWESRSDTPRAQGGPSPSAAQPTGTAHEGGEATLLEAALERSTMLRALQRVERNGGAPGVDGRTVEDLRSFLEELDEWVRRRLRLGLWRQWRRVRTRYRELRKLGVPERDVHVLANTRQGPWRIAGGALNRFFNAAFWRRQGLESVTKRYHQLRLAW
jgi:RNA-directed DNA polymerase